MQTKSPLALADSVFLRYFNFISLYFAEGMHMGILFVGIPAWMAMHGKTVAEIGTFDVACALPWTFKFFIAPIIDRYTYLPMGRKRPWVITGQTVLFLSLFMMSFVRNPLNNLGMLIAAGFCVSFFGAAQDVAIDGLAVDVVPTGEKARTTSLMAGGRMLGSSFALTISTWLLSSYSFMVSTMSIAALVGLVILVPVLSRERREEKLFPWSVGQTSEANEEIQVNNWLDITKSLCKIFRLKNSFLLALLVFTTQGAYNYFEKLLPIFAVRTAGWTDVYYSRTFAAADVTGGFLAILFGGWIIEKYGKRKMINIYFFLITIACLTLIYFDNCWTTKPFIYGFIVIYRWVNAFAKIGVFAIAMQCCAKRVSASQFTFYMTMGAVGSMVGAALITPVKTFFSWQISFGLFAVMMLACVLVLKLLKIEKFEAQVAGLVDLENGRLRHEQLVIGQPEDLKGQY